MTTDRDGASSDAPTAGGRKRRRIDSILDEGYLDGIEEASAAVLRQMRDDCREEESVISYARRVVQGKLDVLFAEVQRRRDADVATDALDVLPEILADHGSSRRHELRDRAVSTRVAGPEDLRRAGERAANIEPLGDLESSGNVELAKRFGKLAVEEERLSEVRSQLLERIDTLNDEIARRYRDGEANVQDVFRP